MQCGVYQISCELTDDVYIGCSTNIRGRMYKHKKATGRGKQKNLYKLIKEYGWESFDIEILELCDKEVIFERETYWMNKLQPNLNSNKKNK
jgi:group I intron endonuclease